ncbi:ATP-binding protein [Gammaproteobacteria bacterium]
MSLKPWREIAIPHRDVLEETFLQLGFNADITAVHSGKAAREYQEATAFFERTFLTDGLRALLIRVARRLVSQGGEPLLWFQAPRGGGKTHALLAAYHLANHHCMLTELISIPELLDQAEVVDLPRVRMAVLDGAAHTPHQHWKRGQRIIRTLWGELAWQLGGEECLSRILNADATGTSPSKETLHELLESHAPCMILMDDLVTYIRQLPVGRILSGGSYDSNLSFLGALIEAADQIPTAIVLAALPESANDPRGIATLRSLEKIFARTTERWKLMTSDEVFAIVGCRLFEPILDLAAQDIICRAFTKTYEDEGAKFSAETQESRYLERLRRAYPIHPEIFDRFHEDWSIIDGFAGTRGILKFMAKAIHRLWKENNRDLMILPGNLPLHDEYVCNDLLDYLPSGWKIVIEQDIDGEQAETTKIENHESRFELVNAARRVARTIFFGSAACSVATTDDVHGVDRAHILLGCLQPGQVSSVYLDALEKLCERPSHLKYFDDNLRKTTSYWYELQENKKNQRHEPTITPSNSPARNVNLPLFHETTEVRAETLMQFTDKINAALTANPRAIIKITLEILEK